MVDIQPEKAIDLFGNPLTWPQVTQQTDRPIELEIGSGKGLFLQCAAQADPESYFVGIELAAKFANKAAARLHKREIPNAVVLRGDAQKFLKDVVPSESVTRLHVYFPDPWWRNKHKKRRVLNEQTLADIQRVLKKDGEFHFWTDVLDYYEHICTEVIDLTDFSGPHYVPERSAAHTMDYTTHFERRARTHGQPVYRARFGKPA